MSEPDSIVSLREVTKRYGDLAALDGLELEVMPGEVMCLLGANGAGKTTTLQVLLGFVRPDSGQASLAGIDVLREPGRARAHVGYLPEVVELYPLLTGMETLRYFEELAGRRLPIDEGRAVLQRTGLPPAAQDQRVGTYSKGMRQKLGLAIALAKRARVLLLDEPMSGLDPASANQLVTLLQEISAQGVAILMVTHDILRAHQVAHRIGIVRRGRLVEQRAAAALTPQQLEELYVHHLRDVA